MTTNAKKKPVRKQGIVYVQKEDKAWHLDRRVPLALIFAMIIQGAAVLTWANGISHSIGQLGIEVAVVKKEMRENQSKFDNLTALNADMRNLVSTVSRLERYLERYELRNERGAQNKKDSKIE